MQAVHIGYICEELQMLKIDIKRVQELTEQLKAISYKITASYGLNAGGGGGMPSSAIENLIIKRNRLQTEIANINAKIRAYNEAIATALTPLEREIVYEIIDGNKLSQYARRKGIYKSTVYKLRDKAIYKIAEYLKNNKK